MKVDKSVLFEDEKFKVVKQRNLRGKYRHSVKIDIYAIDKSTGKPIPLLKLPQEILALVNQAENLS